MHTLLDHAADLFAAHGLGRPNVFRAGGWTLGLENLLALADKGYVADSSPMNWLRLQSAWQGHVLYTWNMDHWASDRRHEPAVLPHAGFAARRRLHAAVADARSAG